MRCKKCLGSGRRFGQGMMIEDCDCVNGEVEPVQVDKRSKAYREAIHKIMQSNDISREEAMKVFDEEFQKIA